MKPSPCVVNICQATEKCFSRMHAVLGPFHIDANYSREQLNSSRRSLCQMQFARTTCESSKYFTY